MFRKVFVFAVALTATLGLAGCAKYSVECELVVMPRLMPVASSAPDNPAYMVRVYVFYNVGDNDKLVAAAWHPTSYADADAGIIRNIRTDEIRSFNIMGEQSDEDSFVHLTLSSSPMLLVAVDPVNRFYAYRAFKYEIPIARLQIPVRFQLWKWEEPYKDSEWIVVSARSEETPPEEPVKTDEQ